MGYYDTALICKNGHVVNESSIKYPAHNSKYCNECGAETINSCPHCNKAIRGEYYVDGVFAVSNYKPPAFCHECGKPYPWTEAKLDALDEIIELLDELSVEEKEELKESSRDITSDNPRTELGVLKIKKLVKKAGAGTWNIIQNIIVQIASETAIKAMEKQGML